jgi:hypothetical protein
VPHPVLDDPDRVTWDQYGVRAWPILVLIDPEATPLLPSLERETPPR